MKAHFVAWAGFWLVCAIPCVAATNPAAASACNRVCLEKFMADYEARVLRHDAKGVAVSENFRATENYRPIRLGEGYWQNVGSIYHQRVFADASTGQVAAMGMLDHGGRDAYYALRLKVVNHRISQSEMFLVHKGDASFFEARRDQPIGAIYAQSVPAAQRSTREQLIKIADQFTDAWQYRNEDLAPLADIAPVVGKCHFFENNVELTDPKGPSGETCGGIVEYGGKNGVRGTGKFGDGAAQRPPGQDPKAGGDPDSGGGGGPPGGPASGPRAADPSIGRPLLSGSQMWMRDRRYPIVDVEKGVVYTYQIQGGEPARAGETVSYDRPVRNGPPGAGAGDNAAYMVALVKIIDGRIVRVDHFETEGGTNASGGFDN